MPSSMAMALAADTKPSAKKVIANPKVKEVLKGTVIIFNMLSGRLVKSPEMTRAKTSSRDRVTD